MKPGTRILIVEDDSSIARLVQLELEHRGLRGRGAPDGPTGLKAAGEFGPAEIDTATREVRRGDRKVENLTAREYDLLEFMARNPRRVLSRDLLLSRVWEQEFGVETNVVDVYIGYLRKKIEEPGETPLIQTIRGVGYALREP